MLYLESLNNTLFENMKNNWLDWINIGKHHSDLYVILIADSRSVLFIIQDAEDTVIEY